MSGPRARALRGSSVAVTVLALAISSGTASADTVESAAARADKIRIQVDSLRTQAEIAVEAYDRVEGTLAVVVSRYISGQKDLAKLQQVAEGDRQVAAGRIVALYQSGGEFGIYSSILQGGGPVDIYDRIHMARTVISGDQAALTASTASVGHVDDQIKKLNGLRDQQRQLETDAAARADKARVAIAKAEDLLAAADADVQRAVAARDAEIARKQAEEFARQVAAAQSLARLRDTGAPTQAAALAIQAARTRIGLPYVWGATGPDAFDCSGLTGWAYAQAGVILPRVAADQFNFGRHVDLSALAPGDLLFWANDVNDPTTIHHVALYIGNGRMIAAPHTGAFVREEGVFGDGFIGATRPSG